MGQSSGFHQAEANGYAAQYPSDTQKRIEECLAKRPIGDVPECMEAAIRASHESQRSEQDLKAQRDMSEWAWWLLIVSIAQIPLSIAGLGALIVTIRQSREANEIARGIGEAQVRAYVKCGNVTCKTIGQDEANDLYSLVIETQNLGQSPALELQVIVGIELLASGGGHIGPPMQVKAPHDDSMAPQGAATAMLKFGYGKGSADLIRKSEAILRFTVAYVYNDVFGKQAQSITYHHIEGSLLDSGLAVANIVTFKPTPPAQ
ncbi:MAG: hypothetical protein ACJLS3_05800 [Erythrobacter sp.]